MNQMAIAVSDAPIMQSALLLVYPESGLATLYLWPVTAVISPGVDQKAKLMQAVGLYPSARKIRLDEMIKIKINDEMLSVSVDPGKPVLWVLREEAQLTGTKYGCGIGQCGACTILLDGKAVRSCVTPIASAEGKSIQTIESLDDELARDLKETWVKEAVPQCGYCQTGQIVSAYALLRGSEPVDTSTVANQMTNICRCGTYKRIHKAVADVASRQS